jgi:hypothetical protein
MKCHDLAESIERLQPRVLPCEVARLCLLLCNAVDDLNELKNEERLSRLWEEMIIRLQAATDQYAAMTAELEKLSSANPKELSLDQIMILFRAIKVQSQVIELYIGRPQTKGLVIGD